MNDLHQNEVQRSKSPIVQWLKREVKIEEARLKKKAALLNRSIENKKKIEEQFKINRMHKAERKAKEALIPVRLNDRFEQAEKRRVETKNRYISEIKDRNKQLFKKIETIKKKRSQSEQTVIDQQLLEQLDKLRKQNKSLEELMKQKGYKLYKAVDNGKAKYKSIDD